MAAKPTHSINTSVKPSRWRSSRWYCQVSSHTAIEPIMVTSAVRPNAGSASSRNRYDTNVGTNSSTENNTPSLESTWIIGIIFCMAQRRSDGL